jgi:hypothetical protein
MAPNRSSSSKTAGTKTTSRISASSNTCGILTEPARAFDLPAEREEDEGVVNELFTAIVPIGQTFRCCQLKWMSLRSIETMT